MLFSPLCELKSTTCTFRIFQYAKSFATKAGSWLAHADFINARNETTGCCFQITAQSDIPSLLPHLRWHTRTWLGRKRRVLICKITFGNSTPLLWMSDQQSKLYWDPLRDDRWDLSLWAWRGAAGDTWYAIRRWCHGCRWLPLHPSPWLSPSPPMSLPTCVQKWQHSE